MLFVCIKKLRLKCCGVTVQNCKYFGNDVLCALELNLMAAGGGKYPESLQEVPRVLREVPS